MCVQIASKSNDPEMCCLRPLKIMEKMRWHIYGFTEICDCTSVEGIKMRCCLVFAG